MNNRIIIDEKVLVEYHTGTSKNDPSYYLTENGEKVTRGKLIGKEIRIQCKGDGSYYKIKSITKSHLEKEYFGFRWRGVHQNPFSGKKHKRSLKNKLSRERKGVWGVGEKNPKYGISNYQSWVNKYGKETADDMESSRRKKMSATMSGKGNPFYGKTHTKESIRKSVAGGKNYRESMTDNQKEIYSKKLSDSQRRMKEENPEDYSAKKARGGRASMKVQMKTWKPNKIESIVGGQINRRKLPFEYGVILGNYQFDFGSKKHRILLEVQGDYWHSNPKLFGKGTDKRQINEIQSSKLGRDKEKVLFCKEHKFRLYKIWESDILSGNFSILDEIQTAIESGR
jgi:very-short-patch-repair endonuclease